MLAHSDLIKQIRYDPETGRFFRFFMRNGNRIGNGEKEMYYAKTSRGYLEVRLHKRKYSAHRLAFFYQTGRWPTQVDHINQVKTDNRWCNLREATQGQNNANVKVRSSTGYKGVTLRKTSAGNTFYEARIRVCKKLIILGRRKDAIEASKLYNDADAKFYGEFANTGSLVATQ